MKGLFQCPPRAAPWVMLANNKVALKGQKLCTLPSILKLLPFQGDFVVSILPRALPWARSFCPFRACGAYWRKFSTRRNDRIRIRSCYLFLDFSQLSFKYPLNNAIL